MRTNCPTCGRINSVSTKYSGTQKVWKCFGANCTYRGKDKEELSTELLEVISLKKQRKHFDTSNLIDARSIPEALEYTRKNNCAGANTKLYYNLNDQRVVFNYKDLYVGRALNSEVVPKWYNYTNTDTPFKVQRSLSEPMKEVLLVEDCASACNASNVIDAIALLGTTLKAEHLDEIMPYERIYIALDEDATTKSLKIYDTLSLVRECKIIVLEKDIKYLTQYEIERLLTA